MARVPRLVAIVAALSVFSVPAFAASNGVVQKAKISMSQARKTALKAFPGGKIMKEELEKERGGSGLRYSFDMKHGKTWREVGVDAMTGKILENKAEGANPKD
jgi:uncharacterized membrane protein YkoI